VAEWWQRRRAALLWCALAGSVAVALKYHFSAAAASDLQWMLHPLAWLLQAAAGWPFLRDAAGNWESRTAGLVLVKACAGINFMVLSFLGWCWMWRPVAPWTPFQWPLRLGGALGCAWLLALGVNTFRILLIVRFQPSLEHWLSPADAHRLLGLMTYLPALCLQGMLADRDEPARAVLLASCLYAFLMLGLPLAGGSAAADPRLFAAHAAESLAVLLPLLGIACWRRNCRARRFSGS
jgi:exosortase K